MSVRADINYPSISLQVPAADVVINSDWEKNRGAGSPRAIFSTIINCKMINDVHETASSRAAYKIAKMMSLMRCHIFAPIDILSKEPPDEKRWYLAGVELQSKLTQTDSINNKSCPTFPSAAAMPRSNHYACLAKQKTFARSTYTTQYYTTVRLKINVICCRTDREAPASLVEQKVNGGHGDAAHRPTIYRTDTARTKVPNANRTRVGIVSVATRLGRLPSLQVGGKIDFFCIKMRTTKIECRH